MSTGRPFLVPSMMIAGRASHLTGVPGAWQHTLATSVISCGIPRYFFKKGLTMMVQCVLRITSSSLFSFVLLTLTFVGGRAARAETRHIELNDYLKITSVSDPQISPDRKAIVFVVSRPNLEQDRSDRELVLLDIATGAQHVLTYERKDVGSPRWSPTGDRLGFVAVDGAGKDAKPQVFILPMTGGEAHKITAASTGVEQFAWRPSGQEIAYVTSDEPENKRS